MNRRHFTTTMLQTALAASLVVPLISCKKMKELKEGAEKVGAAVEEASKYTIITGSKTGNYYRAATELNSVIGDKLTITESAGSFANIEKLGTNQFNLGIAQYDTIMMFVKMGGTRANQANSCQIVARLNPEYVHIIVNKKAKISTLADLKGKKLAVGPDKSGSLVSAFTVMAYINNVNIQKETKGISKLPYEEAIKKVQSGEVDAMFITTSPGMPLLKGIPKDASKNIELLNIPTSYQLPGGIKWTYRIEPIPAGTYPWQEGAQTTLTTSSFLLASKQLSAARVRSLAQKIYSKTTELKAKSDLWKYLSTAGAKQDVANGMLYHLGTRQHLGLAKVVKKRGRKIKIRRKKR